MKKKKLTTQEAIDLTRRQFEPHWHGVAPLFAPIPSQTGLTLLPLSPLFAAHNWLIIYLDPNEANRRAILEYCKEMQRRYEPLGIKLLAILRGRYEAFTRKETVSDFISRRGLKYPVAIDLDGQLGPALGATEVPMLLFYSAGKLLIFKGLRSLHTFEPELHPFLRATDPGLPLLSPYVSKENIPIPVSSVEFGKRFNVKLPPVGITLVGEWTQEDERIVTFDKRSAIKFVMHSKGLSLLAQSISRYATHASIVVQIQGGSVQSSESGRDIQFDHEGNSRLKVMYFGLYNVLTQVLPETEVVLTFPEAHNTQVAIYALKFDD
jgi:hypothetical protein